MSKSGFAAAHLRSFIERVERLNEERAALTADIREVYAEAKGQGFDTKVMRKVVALRKMDTADRQKMEAILDLYRGALGMDGTPLGSYAEREMTDRESADPETGEILKDAINSLSDVGVIAVSATGRTVELKPREKACAHESQAKAGVEMAGSEREQPVTESASRPDARRSASATSETMDATVGRVPTPCDDLEIPAFLLRAKPPPQPST